MLKLNQKEYFQWTSLVGAAILNVMIAQFAHAEGFGAGNSGTVVVCRDPRTGTETAKVLDLYEVEDAPARPLTLTVSESNREARMDSDTQVAFALQRISSSILNSRDPAIRWATTHAGLWNFGTVLVRWFDDERNYVSSQLNDPTNRIGSPYTIEYPREKLPAVRDPNCTYHSVVSYQRDGQFIVDAAILRKIENQPRQLAALKLHEIVYRLARDSRNVEDSFEVRELVALALATADDTNFTPNLRSRMTMLTLSLLLPPSQLGCTTSVEGRFDCSQATEVNRIIRIPHSAETMEPAIFIRFENRMRRRSAVSCQIYPQILNEQGIPVLSADLSGISFISLNRSQNENFMTIRFPREMTYRDLKAGRYRLDVRMECDHPENLSLSNLYLVDENSHATSHSLVRPLDNMAVSLGSRRTIIEFR